MSSPLTQQQILQIRAMRKQGLSPHQIAQRMNVHPSTTRLYTSGRKAEADELPWFPAWPLERWQLRAIQIREAKRDNRNFTLA